MGNEETVYQNKTILMAIQRKQNLWTVVDAVAKRSSKFLILKTSDKEYQDFFFIIFDSQGDVRYDDVHPTTIHRKGRCFYTINALNKLIQMQNDGVLDKQYVIDWQRYQNNILLLNRDKQLKFIPTSLYKLINN